MLMVRVCS